MIPTLNAGRTWPLCLAGIRGQSLVLKRKLIIDSESTDQTVALAAADGFEIKSIRRAEFNHGGTRQWAAEYLEDCDIVIYMTQDAIASDLAAFARLTEAFSDPMVALAYGRQLPHHGATVIEAHARIFNYGPHSSRKDSAAVHAIGTKVFFCSNSFAAYNRRLLLKLGGFKQNLILGEDMEFAARAIKAGYVNQYCALAAVFHSHDYTVGETLSRYFDLGVFDGNVPWMRMEFGSHSGEGLRFVSSELGYLYANAPLSIPRALMQTIAKLVGYRLGRLHRLMPSVVKRKLSMTSGYWT